MSYWRLVTCTSETCSQMRSNPHNECWSHTSTKNNRGLWRLNIMRRNPIAEVSTRCWKAAGISLLVAGLTGLLGCQGVSTGVSGQQQNQSGTLSLGVVSIDFGTVTLGSKQTLSETVTNSGGSSVTVSTIAISGSGFTLNGVTTPVTLTAGQSTTFSISFTPPSAGTATGSVTVTSTASNATLTIALSGTGTASVGQLAASPTTLGLGNVVTGSSGSASGSLTATGANVTVTAATSNNSVFSVGGLSLPVTIPAGQSTPYTVTFSPQVAGAVSATLTFTSNAQPNTTTETLTGTGTAASNHSVNLSWNASTSANITGYNIYRAVFVSSCGSYSKINSVLNTSTLYTDSLVANGTSYCYASTAVNSNNEESSYSNIVSNVQIPLS